jgi:hypothetical protein
MPREAEPGRSRADGAALELEPGSINPPLETT